MILRFLRKHGPFKATIMLAFLAVVASIVLKVIIMFPLKGGVDSADIIASVIIPAIIAPVFSIYLFVLLTKLDLAEERLHKIATTDDLTQLYNRRHFMKLAKDEVARSLRYQSGFSILMMDVDHFKKVNDTHGHMVGDCVLRSLAKTCAKVIRSNDILARFGGEEFIFLLPHTNAAEAVNLAERLRTTLENTPVDCGDTGIDCTVSIGVATSSDGTDSLDDVLKTADRLLYTAKEQGRNRVAHAG